MILFFRNIVIAFSILLLSHTTSAITNALKLKISNTTYSDETVVRYIQGATPEFDGSYDAWKIRSSNKAVPSIYTVIDAASALSINAYPALQKDEKIKIYTTVGSIGTYTITANEVGAFAPNIDIFIENISTGYFQNLRTNPIYTFYVADTGLFNSTTEKFKIHFSLPVVFSIPINTTKSNASCVITKKGITKWSYSVKDYTNAIVASNVITTDSDTLRNLQPGNYTLVSYFGDEPTQEQLFMVYEAISTQINNASPAGNGNIFYANNMLVVDFNNELKHNIKLLLTTIEGGEVVTAKLFDVSKFTVPMRDFPPGIYIVTLQTDEESTIVKKIPIGLR